MRDGKHVLIGLIICVVLTPCVILVHDIHTIHTRAYQARVEGWKGSIYDELWSNKIPFVSKIGRALEEQEKSR